MKVLILYRPKSEHARQVEEYIHDFVQSEPSRKLDVLDIDSREGVATAELYDINAYPAALALSNDGQMLKFWTGSLPLMNELAFYAQSN